MYDYDKYDEFMSNYLPEVREILEELYSGVYSSPNGDIIQETHRYKTIRYYDNTEIDMMDNTDIQLAYLIYYGIDMCPLEIFDDERM